MTIYGRNVWKVINIERVVVCKMLYVDISLQAALEVPRIKEQFSGYSKTLTPSSEMLCAFSCFIIINPPKLSDCFVKIICSKTS